MNQTLRESTATGLKIPKSDPAVRRTRLREFQAQLMDRMQAAQRGTQLRVSQLGIMIGQSRYLLDLREAGEIVSAGNMVRVPLTKDWYLGLSNVRGNLTSVVDLARFDGGQPTVLDSSCRVVAFAPSLAFNSGLLVSQVLGLRNSSDMETEFTADTEVGSAALENKPWILATHRDQDGKLWFELSLLMLVQNQEFLHVGL
ncbi:chemotaxis protein CheW [Undibacterium sp. Ren11W]|uniref:chemotaxis protein CheW n=1 Tax=Undibacterium sp. Ren11W TaxID=3413045 RepID=UPI003BEFD575